MPWWFVPLLIGVGVGITIAVFWDEIREKISEFLRRMGLADSWVMDAWVMFNRVVSSFRRFTRKIFIRGKNREVKKVEEEVVDIEELPEEIREQLKNREWLTLTFDYEDTT